jgi:hypothetical protein
MRVETNRSLVKRNRRITQYLFYFSFGVLIVGLVIGFRPPERSDDPNMATGLLLQTLVLPVAVATSLISVRMTNQWLRQPRPENAIKEALKGINKKSVLYNYYHLPARHVLICPQGVFAMVTRFQDGSYVVNGDKWERAGSLRLLRFVRGDDIGRPNEDAQRAADHVKQLLAPISPDLNVQPLIIFVDPRARLDVSDATIPVLHTDDKQEPNLKDYMRELAQQQKQRVAEPQPSKKKGKQKQEFGFIITPDEIEGLAEAFEEATFPAKLKKKINSESDE